MHALQGSVALAAMLLLGPWSTQTAAQGPWGVQAEAQVFWGSRHPGPTPACPGLAPPYWVAQPPVMIVPPTPTPGPLLLVPRPAVALPVQRTARPQLSDAQLRLIVSEPFANRLLSTEHVNSGPVRDCLLGADVWGDQVTNTRVDLDFQPCDQSARWFVRLNGIVRNSTVGVTRQAAVLSDGAHDVQINKQVDFDGLQLTTRSPSAWITPHIAHRGANTPLNGLPVVGPIAASVALNEAERRRPAAESIAARRITREIAPQFNAAADEQLAEANRLLRERLLPLLSRDHRLPSKHACTTTDQHLIFEARVSAATTASSLSPPDDVSPTGLSLAIHESLINERLALLPLAGREVTNGQLDEWLRNLLSDRWPVEVGPLGESGFPSGLSPVETLDIDRDRSPVSSEVNDLDGALRAPVAVQLEAIQPESPLTELATIVFDQDQPLSVHFDQGACTVTARMAFRLAGLAEIPTQQIDVRLRVTRSADLWTIESEQVDVTSLRPAEDDAATTLAQPIIRQQFEARLRHVSLPACLPVQLPNLPPRTVEVRSVTLESGWLVFGVE